MEVVSSMESCKERSSKGMKGRGKRGKGEIQEMSGQGNEEWKKTEGEGRNKDGKLTTEHKIYM